MRGEAQTYVAHANRTFSAEFWTTRKGIVALEGSSISKHAVSAAPIRCRDDLQRVLHAGDSMRGYDVSQSHYELRLIDAIPPPTGRRGRGYGR
ncbi:hypothetical protein PUN28_004867 [Cardiocondyla obscurior]|uniref:Uncharacterized protein n=1 Tax=Cardiocondyla obscurior TaxID=286306 RepID=A0AAW2GET0_9HYME